MQRLLNLISAFAMVLSLAACGSDAGKEKSGSSSGAGGSNVGGAGAGGQQGVFSTGGANAGGAPCLAEGATCQSSAECCDEAGCNKTGTVPEWLGCRKQCTNSSECTAGCCLLYDGQNIGFCTDAKWCACGTAGATCGGKEPPCCADQFCLGNQCRPRCAQNSECTTNCCVPVPQTTFSACFDPSYCP